MELNVDRASRDQFLRARRLRAARDLRELARPSLRFSRFDIVEDTESGLLFKLIRGEVVDAHHTPAVAYYLDERSDPQFLEPLPGGRG